MSRLVNLTPHVINIVLPSGAVCDVPVSGQVARCSQTETHLFDLQLSWFDLQLAGVSPFAWVEIPVTGQQFGEVVDLPAPQADTFYIVSRLVASACPDRDDLLVPGPLVRNDEGQPVGCRGLSRV